MMLCVVSQEDHLLALMGAPLRLKKTHRFDVKLECAGDVFYKERDRTNTCDLERPGHCNPVNVVRCRAGIFGAKSCRKVDPLA